MHPMSIGQLAKRTGVAVDTVRFYEKQGLLPKPRRKQSGYRQFATDDARRLLFIRRAKELGFSLADIKQLLQLRAQSDSDSQSVARVRNVAAQKLHDVETRIAQLRRMRQVLRELVNACPGKGLAERCPILRAFDRMEESS